MLKKEMNLTVYIAGHEQYRQEKYRVYVNISRGQ